MLTIAPPVSNPAWRWRSFKRVSGLQLVQVCFFLVAFSVYSVAASSAFAAAYYVSTSGSDANNGLSTSSPWRTVAKVNASSFNPGDSILFKRGDTWVADPLIVPSSGSSANPITFGAYGSGALPKFNGNNSTSFTDFVYGLVQVHGKSHIIIENLEVYNTSRDIMNVHSGAGPVTNITLRNCLLHTVNESDWSGVNFLNFAPFSITELQEGRMNNILIEGNTIFGATWNNLRINGGVTDVIIRNNIIHTTPHNGIDIKQARLSFGERNRRFTITGNEIYNAGDTAIFVVEAADVLIDGNKAHNSLIGFKTHDFVGPSSNITVQRNLFYANNLGMFIDGSINTKVYNNTLYANTDVSFINNNTGLVMQNSLMWQNTGGGNFGSDPLFVNPPQGDFRLCDGVGSPVANCRGRSQAIDAGVDIRLSFQGNAPDLGALESGSSSQLRAPTGLTAGIQ